MEFAVLCRKSCRWRLIFRCCFRKRRTDFLRQLPPFFLRDTARCWFGLDRRYPAHYEPSGNDFLSGGLCEAMLMAEVETADDAGSVGHVGIDSNAFQQWWAQFSPTRAALAHWLQPVIVGSRTDSQLVHLDGLNLSRAWCLRSLAQRLPAHRARFDAAATRHLAAAFPHVTNGDFVATHWLVSFALLALGDHATATA